MCLIGNAVFGIVVYCELSAEELNIRLLHQVLPVDLICILLFQKKERRQKENK
jgi:hypothetical protein